MNELDKVNTIRFDISWTEQDLLDKDKLSELRTQFLKAEEIISNILRRMDNLGNNLNLLDERKNERTIPESQDTSN